jgi:hypothetical protein
VLSDTALDIGALPAIITAGTVALDNVETKAAKKGGTPKATLSRTATDKVLV